MSLACLARRYLALFIIGVAAATGGCSVHPLPQDVTGVSTTMIAERIRCEARDAIRQKAEEMLTKAAFRPLDPIPGADVLAARLKEDPGLFKTIRRELNTRERAFYDRYINTSIAYEFTFDMTRRSPSSASISTTTARLPSSYADRSAPV